MRVTIPALFLTLLASACRPGETRSGDSSRADSSRPVEQASAASDTAGTALDGRPSATARDSGNASEATQVAVDRMTAHVRRAGGFGRDYLIAHMDWFTPRFYALLLRDMSDTNGVGWLDADPFIDAQDDVGDARLERATHAGDTIRVRFSFGQAKSHYVVLAMTNYRTRWRIADFLSRPERGGHMSIARELVKANGEPRDAPRDVLAAIRLDGANTVAARMDYDDPFGEHVLDGIGSGDSLWLAVAARLDSITYVDLMEAIPISVAEALPKAPEQVLALVARGRFTASGICAMPFVEPEKAFLADYYRNARAALSRVSRDDLASARDACLAALEKANRP